MVQDGKLHLEVPGIVGLDLGGACSEERTRRSCRFLSLLKATRGGAEKMFPTCLLLLRMCQLDFRILQTG